MKERNTHQRQAVRQVIEVAGRPLTAQEILTLAHEHALRVGIATIYRTVKLFIEEGWLRTLELPGEQTRYEPAALPHHHHFQCRACGRVFCVAGCVTGLEQLTPPGFQQQAHEIILYGRCDTCAQQ